MAGNRSRIDEDVRFGIARRVREIGSFGVVGRSMPGRRQNHVVDSAGVETRCVDQRRGCDAEVGVGSR